jgi:nucleoid-associated protein YgaU
MEANASIDASIATALLPLAVGAGVMLAASMIAAAVEALTVRLTARAPWSWSPAPAGVRRMVFAACGLSLVVAAPSAADAGHGHRHEPRQQAGCGVLCADLDGLRLPDLPVADRHGRARSGPRERPTASIVVRRGDCLWNLAAELIGPTADASDVGSAARALYRANRHRVGPDPNLIFPGTQLTLPEVLR